MPPARSSAFAPPLGLRGVFAATGFETEARTLEALAAGGAGFLPRPMDFAILERAAA